MEATQQFPKTHARPCDATGSSRDAAHMILFVKDPPYTEAHKHIAHQRILYKHQGLTTFQ